MRAWAAAAALLAATGCQGTLPRTSADPALGYGAVLVQGRLLLPAGETYQGQLALNLESEHRRYILPFTPGRASLFVVEPGEYRLYPTRGPFGIPDKTLTLIVERHLARVPFPMAILRKGTLAVRPHRVVPIGVLEATIARPPGSRRPRVTVRLDDSPPARRKLVEQKIEHMLDPRIPLEVRDTAVAWTRALNEALLEVSADEGKGPAFKRASFH